MPISQPRRKWGIPPSSAHRNADANCHLLLTLRSPLSAIGCLLLLLAGCPRHETDADRQPVKKPLEGVKLRLAVADDPVLAAAVIRVRGEWSSQTGSELEVEETTEKDLTRAESLSTDAVLCPSHLLGVLAERGLLAAIPPAVVKGKQWAGIFELLKLREAVWGKDVMAVPFGSPVFTCYYRADLLDKLGRRPPRTWAEYEELAGLLAKNAAGSQSEKGQGVRAWCGTIEPLAPGWAGLLLLARAAPLAKHRDNYSTLFNVATMEPLVAEAAMVEALKGLVAVAKLGPADPFGYDPAAARAAFWNGECGMALTWPTAAEPQDAAKEKAGKEEGGKENGKGGRERIPAKLDPQIRVGFVELPGSGRVFNLTSHDWDNRAEEDDPHVPLLAASGRLGVVSKKSAHVDAALQLLLWLSDDSMSQQISAASPATTMFRQSHLKSPGRWVEKPVSAASAAQYGDAAEATFRHEQWLGALRLPGRDEYLAALDEAVVAAIRGDKLAIDALLDADKKWREITEGLGIEKQKAAYRHSLGLE